jgi:RNA polymerase sigma-70 factor (ECF subfamily)
VAEPHQDVSPDDELVSRLRAGDEQAFVQLVRSMDGMLRRLARGVVGASDLVDEIVQDTWLGVVRGLASFEGRATLRTWICRILLNRARTVAARAGRTVPFSAMALEDELESAAVPDRFNERGGWALPPLPWADERPEALVGRAELLVHVERAIQQLPDRQRIVLLLREVEGWTAEEVCNALELSETNQRVLLHRARGRIRAAIDPELATPEPRS